MKIIDSRGKLFGWINVIDFCALILAVILIRMFFLGYQLYFDNKNALKLVRQEEELKAIAEAHARQRTEAHRKKTIEDRLVSINVSQEGTDAAITAMDARLEALERSTRRSLAREGVKKNSYPQ